jgi:hypothetical protein
MKRMILPLALLLLAAAGAAAYYAVQLVRPWPVPEPVERAENALAVRGLIGLAHLRVEQAVALERLAGAGRGDGALPGAAEESQSRDLLAALEARGVDPRGAVDQWLIGAITSEEGSGLVQILYGDFPVAVVRSALEEAYEVESAPEREEPLLTLTREDVETCGRSEPIAVALGRERIVFGEPTLVSRVLARLQRGDPPQIDLGTWRALRDAHVASAGLFLPRDLGEVVSDPMLGMMLAGLLDQMAPVEAVFVGAVPRLFPPGVVVDVSLAADDADWVREQGQRFASWRSEMEAKASGKFPSAVKLLRHISAETAGQRLRFQVALDPQLRRETEDLVSEGGRLIFSGAGAGDLGAPSGTAGEKPRQVTLAEEELPKYPSPFSADQIPDFARDESQQIEGEISSGPFGVRARAARILRDQGDLVELEIAAQSSRIPNLGSDASFGGETPRLRLFVSRVMGQGGDDLLREEHCGPERNALGQPLQSGSENEFVDGKYVKVAPDYSGAKKVRLREGAQLEDVAAVEGYVELRLPTALQKVRVDAPLAGKVVEGDGVRLEFDAGADGQLSYAISGREDMLLAIRGRNAQGQALKSSGGSSMSGLFGSEKHVSKTFLGEIASVEVILVERESSTRYPFTLEDVAPRLRSRFAGGDNAVVAQDREAFRKEISGSDLGSGCQTGTMPAGPVQPFQLCLAGAQLLWGGHVNTSFELLSPTSRSIEGNLSALELAVDAIWVADPSTQAAEPQRIPARGGDFASPEQHFRSPHLEDHLWLDCEVEEEPPNQQLTHVDGRLIHRLPTKLFPLRLDVSKLGNEIEYTNGFSMKLDEISENGMRIWMRGDRHRIVQFVVRDEQNKAMITTAGPIEPAFKRDRDLGRVADGSEAATDEWIGSVQISSLEAGSPKTLEVLYALGMEETAYPFHVAVPE